MSPVLGISPSDVRCTGDLVVEIPLGPDSFGDHDLALHRRENEAAQVPGIKNAPITQTAEVKK